MARKLQPGEWVRWIDGKALLYVEERVGRNSALVSVLGPYVNFIWQTEVGVCKLTRTTPTAEELERWCLARLEQ